MTFSIIHDENEAVWPIIITTWDVDGGCTGSTDYTRREAARVLRFFRSQGMKRNPNPDF